jgi:predicted RNA binding protein YcfA (HicA-like mRNA interferase family)
VSRHKGSTIVPTGPRYPSLPSRKVEKALGKKFDYQRVHGGKGSHVRLISPSGPPIILPGDRKDLAPHVLRNVASTLNFASIAKLISHLDL